MRSIAESDAFEVVVARPVVLKAELEISIPARRYDGSDGDPPPAASQQSEGLVPERGHDIEHGVIAEAGQIGARD